MNDWRGYVIAGFALVWIANAYMSVFGFLRQDIKKEKTEIECLENGNKTARVAKNKTSDSSTGRTTGLLNS